jgi:O-antigen/teichoic acid export membrane protein
LVVANVLGLLLGSGERYILAVTHPIRTIAHYSVAANLSQVIAVVPIAVCQPLLPAFSRLEAVRDAEQSAALYRRALTSILVAILPLALAVAVVGKPFLNLWAGPEYGSASIGPLRLLLIGVVVNSCAFVPYNFLLGIGASNVIVRCHLLELPLYPLYALPLISKFGATGAAAVWTLRLVLVTGIMFVAAARHGAAASAPLRRTLARIGPSATVLVVPLAAEVVARNELVPAAILLVALPVYAWLAWTRVLHDDDRTQILRFLHSRRSH